MRHALALGRRGQGGTSPNPAVGCIVVAHNRIVGRGWTQPGGRPHAEPMALAQAGLKARGATCYVTLEPCAHIGKTPPCAEALIAAGVGRVVVALQDPDPRVSGRGLEKLREAGIAVELGLCADEAARDLHGFLLSRTQNRPAVTLKLAMTLDGRIATASGESQWITGSEARRAVHAMRLRHDAVLVGGGTARADDPALTVRGMNAPWQPVRVVMSRKLDMPKDSILARTAREVPVWLLHGPDVPKDAQRYWSEQGARCFEVPLQGRQVSVPSALNVLAEAGITRVLCEGGGQLAASVMAHQLVDELAVFSAGFTLGAEGQPGLGAMGLERLAEAERFTLLSQQRLGADLLSIWRK